MFIREIPSTGSVSVAKKTRWRPQFSLKLLLAAPVVIAVAFYVLDGQTAVPYSGMQYVPLTFRVVDAETGEPIRDASFRGSGTQYGQSQHLGGPPGHFAWFAEYRVTGHKSLLRNTRSINYAQASVEVSAAGYMTVLSSLSEYTNDSPYHPTAPPYLLVHPHNRPPVIEIRLRRVTGRPREDADKSRPRATPGSYQR